MERFILRDSVVIHGRDFWGRKASVRLDPVDKAGWFWHAGGKDVLIDQYLPKSAKNRIALLYDAHQLHTFEHLGALRFAGLDCIRITAEGSWLPYDGSASIFWNACREQLIPAGKLDRWCVSRSVDSRDGERSVACIPGPYDKLLTDISIDYPGLGTHRQVWAFPCRRFEQFARVKTQGWPPSRYSLARVAARLGWPHANNAVWPQEHRDALAKRFFARHRALDILGAFSVLCPPGGILVGTITSRRGGHTLDVDVVQRVSLHSVENIRVLQPELV